jgi:signal transduction histidine kinase
VAQTMPRGVARPLFGPAGAWVWTSSGVVAVGLITAGAVTLTAVEALGSVSPFPWQSTTLHAVLETVAGLAAILVAPLLLRRSGGDDTSGGLLASAGLVVLGASCIVAAIVTSNLSTKPVSWAALVVVGGGSLLAAAAYVPRRWADSVALRVCVTACCVAGLLLVGLATRTVDETLVLEIAAVCAVALAALGLRRRARTGERLALCFTAGAVLGSLASLDGALLSLHRAGFFVLVLVVAIPELAARQGRLAAAQERRRVARDLHDGIAQDLAFIATQMRLARSASTEQWIADVADAADRASAEIRGTMTVLSNTSSSLADLLLAAAEDVAHRDGARVRITADDSVPPSSTEARQTLAWMVREAVTNAVLHGHATTVEIRLDQEQGGSRLTISDDGDGFDPIVARDRAAGFGLGCLHARAHELGGHVRVQSSPGQGTSVVVVVP